MRYFVSILFVFLLSGLPAISSGADSLKIALERTTEDTTRAILLYRISDELSSDKVSISRYYASRALALSDSIGFKKGIYKSLFSLGYCQIVNGEYKNAIATYQRAIDVLAEMNKPKWLPQTYNRMAAAYYYQGDFENALKFYFETIKKAKEVNDPESILAGYSGIANVYYSKKDYANALKFYKEILDQKNLQPSVNADVLNNIASVFLNVEKEDSAIYYYGLALEIYKKSADSVSIANTLMNLGLSYLEMKELDKSINYLTKALSIFKNAKDISGTVHCYINLAETYQEKNQYDKSLDNIKSAVGLVENSEQKELIRDVYEKASSVYAEKGMFEQAYSYFKKYTDINDTLLNIANSESMNRLSTEFETEKKEGEIKQLNIENKHKDTQRNFMIAISFLGLVVTFFVYRSYREKKKANKDLAEKNTAIRKQKREIESQKAIVDIQNKEITDSINYAKQIQNAILPAIEQIEKALPDSFVLYKPKAIVSGDFYFFTEKGNKIILAAVDCTGHGVPGAFMSMIGNNLLDQIIIENGITTPSEILNNLHLGVRKMLQQNDANTGNRDGMDIALISIDRSMKTLEYAGANRPLYYIRNSELNEVKSNKFSIGGFQAEEERKFTNHIIELQKNDSVYLFSDGYADQFGGTKGKKFMVKNMQQALLDIHGKPMVEQRGQLDKIFESWRGGVEQVDDVLVIGIKIS